MNNITIELAAEDRKRLDDILEALKQRPDCRRCVQSVVAAMDHQNEPQSEEKPQAKEEPEAPVFVEEAAAPPWEEGVPAEVAEPTEPTYTQAEVRKKVVELCAAGHKEATRAIVSEYAPSVSDIPADKYDEVMGKLLKLEG